MTIFWILFIGISVASYAVSAGLQSKFKKYSKIPLLNGMTGKDVAQQMLRDNGITDLTVLSTSGSLTDHFDPQNKTVNLSEGVFDTCSVAAAAVAAHECGHAVQHAKGYAPLKMRSALVPIVSISSRYVSWILLAGMLLLSVFPMLLIIGILLFALTTIFSFITLPVEIDASKRALDWLEKAHIVNQENKKYATDALKWAAYTYVVAALGSLATLCYYIMIALNGRNRV